MCGAGLNRGGRGSRGAASGCGEARSSGDISELRAAGNRDDGKRAVVRGDADAGEGHGITGAQAVRGRGSYGDEKTVFRGAIGASGDSDSRRLRRAAGARDDGDDHVFVDHSRPRAGSTLADTIEIGVIELPRQIIAYATVTDGQ